MAAQIASFLMEMHGFGELARSAGIPVRSPSAFAADLEAEVDELLLHRMSPLARDRARRELAALAEIGDEAPALCHTDIGGNILLDDRSGDVAIIDFGSCFITDPVLDVAVSQCSGRNS